MCMTNPIDQFITYTRLNPTTLTDSQPSRNRLNPQARRLTATVPLSTSTVPLQISTVPREPVVTPTEPAAPVVAEDVIEALKASIYTDFIAPFIASQVSQIDDIADVTLEELVPGQVLKWTGTTWTNGIDATVTAGTGTGFAIAAATAQGGANIVLSGTDASTDAVRLAAGANVTIVRTDADTITISAAGGGGGGAVGSSTVSALTDVQLTALAVGQVLKWTGTRWANSEDLAAAAGVTAIVGLTDVAIAGPVNGQVLKYDSAQLKWVNGVDATAAPGGGGGLTYSVSAETVSGVTQLRLTGSDASTDSVRFAAGSNISILRTDADTITLASTYAYVLPTATAAVLGGVKPDGTTITINSATGVISAATGSATVSSVSGTGTVSGLTLSGTVTTTGSLTLAGTLSLTSGNVTTALGYTPYNSSNPNSYITIGDVSGTFAPLASPGFSGNPTASTQLTGNNSTRLATTAFVKAQGYTANVGDATLAGTQTFTGAKTFTGGLTSVRLNFDASTNIQMDATNFTLSPSSAGIKFLVAGAVNGSTLIGNVGGAAAYEFNSADFRCSADASRTLGTSNSRWGQIYSVSGSINTSDQRSKTDIVDCPLGLDFVLDLDPKFYKLQVASNIVDPNWTADPNYVPGANDPALPRPAVIPVAGQRYHSGLLAQQVRAALDRAGIVDWAGWGLDDKDDVSSRQHLRYDEFIAPLIKSVHTVCDRLDALEQRLSNLESS